MRRVLDVGFWTDYPDPEGNVRKFCGVRIPSVACEIIPYRILAIPWSGLPDTQLSCPSQFWVSILYLICLRLELPQAPQNMDMVYNL